LKPYCGHQFTKNCSS